MARTKQYVTYTREFSKGNVNSKIGVFIEEAKNATDNSGNINGGVIKFKNLKMSRPTPTRKLKKYVTIAKTIIPTIAIVLYCRFK